MDRRGFVRSVLGVAAAAATSRLWLPPVSTAVARPERRLFVPPAAGWLTGVDWGEDENFTDWPYLVSMDGDGFTITGRRGRPVRVRGSIAQPDGPAWMVSGLGFQPSGVVLNPISEWAHTLNDGGAFVTVWTVDGELHQARVTATGAPTGSAGSS